MHIFRRIHEIILFNFVLDNRNSDDGDDEISALSHLVDKTAEKLSVVMFRSLTTDFKINVAHSTTHGPIVSSQVAQLIESTILHLSSVLKFSDYQSSILRSLLSLFMTMFMS